MWIKSKGKQFKGVFFFLLAVLCALFAIDKRGNIEYNKGIHTKAGTR